jgi:hypothetical protein
MKHNGIIAIVFVVGCATGGVAAQLVVPPVRAGTSSTRWERAPRVLDRPGGGARAMACDRGGAAGAPNSSHDQLAGDRGRPARWSGSPVAAATLPARPGAPRGDEERGLTAARWPPSLWLFA